MKTRIANQVQSREHAVQTKSESSSEVLPFLASSPQAAALRASSATMNNGPRALKAQSLADGINNSPRVMQMRATAEGIRSSPRLVVHERMQNQLQHADGQRANRSASSNSQTIQCISAGDARQRLNVRDDDLTAAAAVEIIQLIHQIIDETPALEAVLAEYPAFLDSHAGRSGLAAKKSDFHRWMGASMKFITDKLASYIEVLEGIEDWYTEAAPRDRNEAANAFLATWREEAAAFHDNIAPIGAIFAERTNSIYEGNATLGAGLQSLARIRKILHDWLSSGGGFSALGRAHDVAAEVVEKGAVPEDNTLVKDNRVLDSYLLGKGRTEYASKDVDVYRTAVPEASEGPLIVAGRNRTTAENGNRAVLLTEAEGGLSAVTTSDTRVFAATPAAQDRGKGQHFNMNNTNARGYAWLVNMPGWNSSKWEWLHVKAASLGGVTNSSNLILGTRDANTQMMPFESNVRTLASLVHSHPHLKDLTVEWTAHYKHPGAGVRHSYELISIFWVVHPEDDAGDDLKEKADNAGGKAIFDVLHTESVLSKAEVKHLEDTLSAFRETLRPEAEE